MYKMVHLHITCAERNLINNFFIMRWDEISAIIKSLDCIKHHHRQSRSNPNHGKEKENQATVQGVSNYCTGTSRSGENVVMHAGDLQHSDERIRTYHTLTNLPSRNRHQNIAPTPQNNQIQQLHRPPKTQPQEKQTGQEKEKEQKK